MEVITRDTEEVRAYFEALEEGMRYLDTVTAHFRPAMNGEVYLTGEDVCRLLHITPRTLQDYRTQRLIPYISLPGKTLYRQSDLLRMLEENYVDMRPKRKRGKVQHKRTGVCIGKCSESRDTASEVPAFAAFCTGEGVKPFPGGAAHPLSVLSPVLLLQHAPLHGGEVAGDRPEIGAYHPVGHLGVDLGRGNVLVPEYLGERLDGAAVAEIDGRGEGVAA